jgi:CRISPR-associated protein Csb2
MPEFLCISVHFYDPRFHGQGDGGAPEWPPSPLRLYQAMVAACAARGLLDSAQSALRWLEQQSAPAVISPTAFLPQPYRIAVPNNDLDVPARYWAKGVEAPKYKNPQDLKSMKTIRPTHFEAGDTIHFLYALPRPLPQDVSAHVRLLASAARSVTHVGWGVDLVAAEASVIGNTDATRFSGQRWIPVDHAGTKLRVPQSGTLDALTVRHNAFLHRICDAGYTPVPPLTCFRTIAYDNSDRINPREFAAFNLAPADPADRRARRAFRQEDVVRVAAMIRHAARDAAEKDIGDWRDEKWVKEFVAGHGPHEDSLSFARFSYLPLPTIGHGYADGMIRRALIAETAGGDGRSAGWAARRLGGMTLCDEKSGTEVALLNSTETEGDPVFEMYHSKHGTDRWQTITPIILPGFDDNDHSKRLKLLLRCFDQIGIPREIIADLEVQKSPWLRASAQPRSYFRPDRLRDLPACHVRAFLKRRISGPLALGAGRHRGLGVLAAMD